MKVFVGCGASDQLNSEFYETKGQRLISKKQPT